MKIQLMCWKRGESYGPNYEQLPLALTVEDLSRLLTIGRNTAYELVRSGKIRSIRVGRIYRIPQSAVDEYLNAAR